MFYLNEGSFGVLHIYSVFVETRYLLYHGGLNIILYTKLFISAVSWLKFHFYKARVACIINPYQKYFIFEQILTILEHSACKETRNVPNRLQQKIFYLYHTHWKCKRQVNPPVCKHVLASFLCQQVNKMYSFGFTHEKLSPLFR